MKTAFAHSLGKGRFLYDIHSAIEDSLILTTLYVYNENIAIRRGSYSLRNRRYSGCTLDEKTNSNPIKE